MRKKREYRSNAPVAKHGRGTETAPNWDDTGKWTFRHPRRRPLIVAHVQQFRVFPRSPRTHAVRYDFALSPIDSLALCS